jgi:hypothetical protein
MREVESAPAGHQKFPAHGALCVSDDDLRAGGVGNFRRAQSRRTAADDEHRICLCGHAKV